MYMTLQYNTAVTRKVGSTAMLLLAAPVHGGPEGDLICRQRKCVQSGWDAVQADKPS